MEPSVILEPVLSRNREEPRWQRWARPWKLVSSSEMSGAVGDMGTFIPIVLALALVCHLDLSTTLIFTGLYNIATGLLFDVPMPVQPMKSIAAVAVSELPHFTPAQISTAGASTALILLVLGATGLMSTLYRLVPLPVVRGVQLAQGLSFALTAVKYIRYNQDFVASKSAGARPWLGLDGLLLCLCSLIFLIMVTGSGSDQDEENQENQQQQGEDDRLGKRFRVLQYIPGALLVFLLGVVLCFLRDHSILSDLKFGPSRITVLKFTWEDWKVGFLRGAIPQIPLSILNSVIAVCKLSADLFPDREVSATKVSVSVGLMNLVGCWFGAMPVCHGAGGLAGQYRFGARSGCSVVLLGLGKLVIALILGRSFANVLSYFPVGILGTLLLFSGIELAMASRDMNNKEQSFVMLFCAAVSLSGSSAALGFCCGIVLHLMLKLRSWEFSFTKREAIHTADRNLRFI